MTSQKRNDELANILRPDFFARAEPNASMVHYQSAILSTCGLQGFWPMSASINTGTIYARDIACGYDLTLNSDYGSPEFGYLSTVTITALPPWALFWTRDKDYMAYAADSPQHDIIGNETYISANENGLTIGGWFKFSDVPASWFGLISKWWLAGNDAAYALEKSPGNGIVFSVTTDGATIVTIVSTTTVVANTWYHLYGRFDPSTEISVFVDNVKTTNAVGTPATVFNADEPLGIGWSNRANYLNGKASMCHLNASYLSDSIIELLWEQSRVMYGK
jgi:hypothetical protein